MKEFLTKNQHEVIRVSIHARDNATTIGIISPSGIGMKYAITKILRDFPHEKIIYCDAQFSGDVNEICVALIRVCSNVRFSNLNYRKAELFDLVRILKDRMKKDVKGKPLIVMDNVWALSNEQMKRLNSFITMYAGYCGLILRTTKTALRRFKNAYPETFDRFYSHTVDDWLVLNESTPKEIGQFITAYGIHDKAFIEDLAARSKSFTLVKKYVDKYNRRQSQ
ncbi:MAG: hypothetical protein ACK5YS_03535 [bacterium]|jgi:hypothetical protein